MRVRNRDNLDEFSRNVTSEGEHKSLINKGFIPLLIRRSLVRAQVEEPNLKPRNRKVAGLFVIQVS